MNYIWQGSETNLDQHSDWLRQYRQVKGSNELYMS